MALNFPKLSVPKLTLDKKKLPLVVGGVIVLAAAGWFGWQYFMEPPAPPPAPVRSAATKPVAPKPQSPADIAQAQDKLIEDVLAATGLKQQLALLPQRLVAGVNQAAKQQKKAPAATLQAINEAMSASFTAEGFQTQVRNDLKKNFDQKRMQALLKEFSTPAAKSMVEMERPAQSPQELDKFAHSAAATKPERVALVKRIDAASKASDLAVETAFVSMKALSAGIAGERTSKASAIDKSIEKQRDAETQKIRDATLLGLAYSYKDASDADLAKYAALYETEEAKWFYGLVYTALVAEVKNASTQAGERIAALTSKPAAAAATVAAKTGGSRSRADARSCLKFATNAGIAKCAEAYR